eukprot:366470-Chlamydomonas_euryale.AAC.8
MHSVRMHGAAISHVQVFHCTRIRLRGRRRCRPCHQELGCRSLPQPSLYPRVKVDVACAASTVPQQGMVYRIHNDNLMYWMPAYAV